MRISFLNLIFVFMSIIASATNSNLKKFNREIASLPLSEKIDRLCENANSSFAQSAEIAFDCAHLAVDYAQQSNDSAAISKSFSVLANLFQQTSCYDSALVYYKRAVDFTINPTEICKLYNCIGVLYKDLSDFDNAIKYHLRANNLCETIGDKHGVAYSLNLIGNVYVKQSVYDDALRYYNKSLHIRRRLDDVSEIAASLNNIGEVYKRLNDYDRALQNLTEALDLFKDAKDSSAIAYTFNLIGNFYLQLKIYDKAREYYSQSLDIRMKLNDKMSIAASLTNIGTIHRDLGNFDKALDYYNQAFEIRKQFGNKESVAISFNNIGGLYWKNSDFGKAIEYYHFSLDILNEIGNKSLIANTLKNIGIIYKEMHDYNKSLESYQQALDEYFSINDNRGIATIQNLKGNVYRQLNELDRALEFYDGARSIFSQSSDRLSLVYVEINMGEVCAEQKHYSQAILHFEHVIENATLIQERHAIEKACLCLSQVYESINNNALALKYYKQYTDVKDSIAEDMTRKSIAEIEFESAIKSKDLEINSQELQLEKQQDKISQQRATIIVGIAVLVIIIAFLVIIFYQYSLKRKANKIIAEKSAQLEKTNIELEDRNQKITDSINYAKRIQQAILPTDATIKNHFPESFVFYKPKEIVSGDFYWFSEQEGKLFLAVVDCTGHGVPGAFMSMIGNTLLNEIVNNNKISDTAEILNRLDEGVIKALKQDVDNDLRQEDGMDLSLICIDKTTQTIEFSGANHNLTIVDNDKIEIISGDILPIGGMVKIKRRRNAKYSKHQIEYHCGMSIYLSTDGYIDQFGESKNERFSSRRFRDLLISLQSLTMVQQVEKLDKVYCEWKGLQSQIDDVTVIGINL